MFDSRPQRGPQGRGRCYLQSPFVTIGLALLAFSLCTPCVRAASSGASSNDSMQGTSSTAARKGAVQSIPFDKLDADSRAKVNSVLNNAAIYRRLPTRTVNCDPDLYLFLVRHPDVVVNIWELLGVAQIQLRQTDIDSFRIAEAEGTAAALEFLYHSRDLQVVYGKWTYTGPLLAHKINGHCLAVLRSNYAKDPNGRYYVTARLDGFVSVESGGAELLARTLQPLMVKNVDANFVQTIAFLGSLSKTAEVNPQGMQRLAERLGHVQEGTRQQLGEVVQSVTQRAAANEVKASGAGSRVAARPQAASDRQ
jgi:hypothetical protein